MFFYIACLLTLCLNCRNSFCESSKPKIITESGTIDLESFVDDLYTAAAATQYTANLTLKLVQDLQEHLLRKEVQCQCDGDNASARIYPGKTRVFYSTFKKTWNDARKICNDENGTLLVANDLENKTEPVFAMALSVLRTKPKDALEMEAAFVGLHRLFDDKDWVSISGKSVSGSINMSSLPNGKCAILTAEAEYRSADCNVPRRFICQYNSWD